MSEIEDQLKANRPALSAGSIRTYSSILRGLGKALDIPVSSEEILKNHKAILEHLKGVPPSVRKTRLSALVVYLEKNEKAAKTLESFRSIMMEDKKTSEDEDKKQERSERQKEAWMSWSDVMESYEALKAEVAPLMKRDKLDKKQFARVQLFVLLSLLVLIPPRRSLDWTAFKLRDVDEEKDNFLKTVKRKPILVFNRYKTAGKTGRQEVEAPKALAQILKRWMELNPHDWLLMNHSQTGSVTPTQLTQMLYGFFGRNVSTTMLRSIFLSDKYKDVPALKEMEETAEKMGHSVGVALTSYVKKA